LAGEPDRPEDIVKRMSSYPAEEKSVKARKIQRDEPEDINTFASFGPQESSPVLPLESVTKIFDWGRQVCAVHHI
jgi:hypothetical protein